MTTLGAPVSWPWNIGFVWNQKWMVNHHTPWNVGTFGIYQIYPLFWQNPWIEMVFILSSACRLACRCLSCHSGMQALSDPLREWGYELRDLRSEEGARSKLGWFFMCLYMYTYIYIYHRSRITSQHEKHPFGIGSIYSGSFVERVENWGKKMEKGLRKTHKMSGSVDTPILNSDLNH